MALGNDVSYRWAGRFRPRAAGGTSRRSLPSPGWRPSCRGCRDRGARSRARRRDALVTVVDRAPGKRFTECLAHWLALRQKLEDRPAVGDDHGVRQLLQRRAHLCLAVGIEIVHGDHLATLVAPLVADAALAIVEI